ncbi:LppP/LprE family lipoprotein [Mycolicibacterium sp. P1-18]|uniref:LppP/LprE family lipoprotein n=1 Tax=Mycolicibacterium sp. P1-18 TaxID=2024615 RepID=UPI001F5C0425|nr:LppP/LprE family lipoprotein [Mycolicibacterium sp. P1-18]
MIAVPSITIYARCGYGDVVGPEARIVGRLMTGIAGAFIVAASFAASKHAAPAKACGVDLNARQVRAAVKSLPPYPGTNWTWSTDPASMEGNFDPCATLSTALVTVEMATGSSPITALMFHDGKYLGTATPKAYGFTSLDPDRSTDDTVVLDYKLPGACNACAPASVTSVRYQWSGDHVAMLDPAPPSS